MTFDFLKDEDTRLDITNPVILLKADNPLETDVEIDAVLTPKKNNVNIEGHEVKIGTGYGQNKVALIRYKYYCSFSYRKVFY